MSPVFTRDIQLTLLRTSINLRTGLLLRGYHPLWHVFPDNFEYPCPRSKWVQHHISQYFHIGIQFVLYRVRSPLLAVSRLISFHAGTKMLHSRALPVITDNSEEQEVPLGDRRIIGFLHLPDAYRSLTRPSSVL